MWPGFSDPAHLYPEVKLVSLHIYLRFINLIEFDKLANKLFTYLVKYSLELTG